MTVAPGSFVVHEDALLATTPRKSSEGTGVPQACDAPLMKLQLHDSCSERCGPVRVALGGTRVATLLGPEVRRPSTVDPERVERPYATPPVDGSRRAVALAAGNDPQAAYTVESACSLRGRSGGGPAPTQDSDKKLSFHAPATCGYVVEVSCK